MTNLREKVFWFIDRKNGSIVANNIQEIDQIYNGNQIISKQLLTNILKYAVCNVPYYKSVNSDKIVDFPVINKTVIKKNYTSFLSKDYSDINKLYKASTSGSTGTPLNVYQNTGKRKRLNADLIYAHSRVNWNLGDHYIFIRNWTSNYKKSVLGDMAKNVTNISITDFNDEKKKWLYRYLCHHPNCVLFGYSSSICDFLNYVIRNKIDGIKARIKVIVCDSDYLSDKDKYSLEKVFGCPVINRYDNEENGLIAITHPFSNQFIVNYPSLFVELLKIDSDERVQPGETGRIIITDLFNYAMPLIRYDTGDLAISNDEPSAIKSFESFVGRGNDYVVSVDGRKISAVAICAITEIFSTIDKYQLKQISKKSFVFNYIGFLSQDDFNELHNKLLAALGKTAEIKYIQSDSIPFEGNGKFKTVVLVSDE